MPINIIADKADELPEPLRQNAQEQGGKFVVSQLPDGWGVDNVASYRAKMTKAEQDARRAAERMKVFAKDEKGTIYEPEEFQALVQEHRALKEQQGKQVDVEAWKRQYQSEFERAHGAKLTAAQKQVEELDAMLDRTMTDAEINALVAAARPKEGNQEVIRLLLREVLKVDKREGRRALRVAGANGDYLISATSEDGYVAPKDYLTSVFKTKYAHLLEPEQSGGAGATGSGGRTAPANVVRISRASLNGHADEAMAAYKKAMAEKKKIEFVD